MYIRGKYYFVFISNVIHTGTSNHQREITASYKTLQNKLIRRKIKNIKLFKGKGNSSLNLNFSIKIRIPKSIQSIKSVTQP